MRAALTERFVASIPPATPPSSLKPFCYCGDYLEDLTPAPKGSVHHAAVWHLVMKRLCPTVSYLTSPPGFEVCCSCRRRCPCDRFVRALPDIIDLRELAIRLRLMRGVALGDILARRAVALGVLTSAALNAKPGRARNAAIAAEWSEYLAAQARVKALTERARA